MKTSKWRLTLLLPPEAENQLQLLAAKLGVDRQEMMRDAVMSLLQPAQMPLTKQDEDVLRFLRTIAQNSPKIADGIRNLIFRIAEETPGHGNATLDQRIEDGLGNAARLVDEAQADKRRNKAPRRA